MSKIYSKLIVAFIVAFVFSCLAPAFTIAAEKPTSKKYLGTHIILGSTKKLKYIDTYSFYPWSSWKKTKTVYRKGYTVNKVKPTLKKK